MAVQEVSQVVMDASTVTTIANNLNSLYSNAISQLTTYTIGVIGLVGILIPALVTLIQWRSLKTEKEGLQSHIESEISKAKADIRECIGAEAKTLIASMENKIVQDMKSKFIELEKQLACADASDFHLQGLGNLDKNFFAVAAGDFAYASSRYLHGGDEQNAQRTLKLLTEKCLPKMISDDFELFEDIDEKIEKVLAEIAKKNENGRYAEHMANLAKERKDAKKRAA